MKIYAFIVTYNRLDSLKRVVECVKNQTYNINEIYIINNNSTDGTADWLKSVQGIKIIHQDNIGGAGGFHTGVKTCYEQGADWIWMMDDDVFPQKDCLETLLKYTNISGCLNTTRYWADGGYVPQNFYFDINNNTGTDLGIDLTKEYISMNTCCFEGLLISREVVAKIGFPDKRFFIAGDDTIYGYLASLNTNVILVRDAKAQKLQKAGSIKPRPFYIYYSIRNQFLINEYKKNLTGKGFTLSIWICYYLKVIVLSIRYLIEGEPKIFNALWRGCFDGLRKKQGKSF